MKVVQVMTTELDLISPDSRKYCKTFRNMAKIPEFDKHVLLLTSRKMPASSSLNDFVKCCVDKLLQSINIRGSNTLQTHREH